MMHQGDSKWLLPVKIEYLKLTLRFEVFQLRKPQPKFVFVVVSFCEPRGVHHKKSNIAKCCYPNQIRIPVSETHRRQAKLLAEIAIRREGSYVLFCDRRF